MGETGPSNAALPNISLRNGRRVRFGLDRLSPADRPRHRHSHAYATVVLSGSFEQIGYFGRYRVDAGCVLLQPTLDVHSDRMLSRGLEIIRLPWRFDTTSGGVFWLSDVETIRESAERAIVEASAVLDRMLPDGFARAPIVEHEADLLAQDFLTSPSLSIGVWADAANLSREGLSRSFRRAYGESAVKFRNELRARAAWRACVETDDGMASIAAALGYADQPHMTHAVQLLTGATPALWRRWSKARQNGSA